MTPLTPEEARDQLAAAETLARTSGKGARIVAFTMAAVGVLVAAALAMSNAFAKTNPLVASIGFAVYGLAIGALMFWYARHVRVWKEDWGIRYGVSFGLTMALYAIGVAWSSGGSPSWAVLGPYCILVAVPMIVAAIRIPRR